MGSSQLSAGSLDVVVVVVAVAVLVDVDVVVAAHSTIQRLAAGR